MLLLNVMYRVFSLHTLVDFHLNIRMLATILSRTFCLPVCCQKDLEIRIYKTILLPAVLYGCETWSVTLWAEYRLGVFGNRVLMKIFGPRRDEVIGEWRKNA
jgi:hypothetical protein